MKRKSLLDMPSQQRPDDVKSNANDLQTKIKRQDRAAERFMRNFQDAYGLKEDEIKMAVRITLRSDKLHFCFKIKYFEMDIFNLRSMILTR